MIFLIIPHNIIDMPNNCSNIPTTTTTNILKNCSLTTKQFISFLGDGRHRLRQLPDHVAQAHLLGWF
jgi:hypothetical protein